jgi:hypothetical protein
MRVLIDLASHITAIDGNGYTDASSGLSLPWILQVEKRHDFDVTVPINGKYVIPIIEGTSIKVDDQSYVLPIDGGDISSLSYANLLVQYPMYESIYFNPLLDEDNVGEIATKDPFTGDPVAFVDQRYMPHRVYPARYQSGRSGPDPEAGQAPNNTAVLEVNPYAGDYPHPGVLITNPIDITDLTLDENECEQGANEFMVYWKIYDFEVTDDILSGYGQTAGMNLPAIRSIKEVEQEPEGLEVYLSINKGANWHRVGRLENIAFCDHTTEIMLAFLNFTGRKIYISSYAVMF